jgi:hypothetical protein
LENDFDKFSDKIMDVDEIQGTDIKINPDFYIHSGLLKAQQSLTKENVKEGFLQYRVIIEHIEILCLASNMINKDDYEIELNKFKESEDYINSEDTLTKSVKLANKKLYLMMESVFQNKVTTEPMRL